MTTDPRPLAVVSLSGGMDSTTLLAHYAAGDRPHRLLAVSVDYGQRHVCELDAARAVAAHYAAEHLVVDLRVGSPTFARWDAVELAADTGRAVYFPPGVGHAFVALEDDSVVCYLLSAEYRAENELTLSVFDEEIGVRLPEGPPPILSERDRTARTLGEAAACGLLPEYIR